MSTYIRTFYLYPRKLIKANFVVQKVMQLRGYPWLVRSRSDLVFVYPQASFSVWPDEHIMTLQWRHRGRDGVSNHQPHDCLLNRVFRRRSKKTSKLRVIGLCAGNSAVTGEFPAQMAGNAENVSFWWRHHDMETLSALRVTGGFPSQKSRN